MTTYADRLGMAIAEAHQDLAEWNDVPLTAVFMSVNESIHPVDVVNYLLRETGRGR